RSRAGGRERVEGRWQFVRPEVDRLARREPETPSDLRLEHHTTELGRPAPDLAEKRRSECPAIVKAATERPLSVVAPRQASFLAHSRLGVLHDRRERLKVRRQERG